VKAITVAMAGPSASDFYTTVIGELERCQVIPGIKTVPPDFVAEDCFLLAQYAYFVYLDTGQQAWFTAAENTWNYAWNHDFGAGAVNTFGYDRAKERNWAVHQLRAEMATKFPQYLDLNP
jgi:hypothetical protein